MLYNDIKTIKLVKHDGKYPRRVIDQQCIKQSNFRELFKSDTSEINMGVGNVSKMYLDGQGPMGVIRRKKDKYFQFKKSLQYHLSGIFDVAWIWILVNTHVSQLKVSNKDENSQGLELQQ